MRYGWRCRIVLGESFVIRSVLAAICVAFALPASDDVAEPFEQFVDFCLNTNAEREVVAGAVKSAGWFTLPAEELFEDDTFLEPALFIRDDPATFTDKGAPPDMGMIITGWGEGEEAFDIPGVRMDLCMVVVNDDDRADGLRHSLQDLLGFEAREYEGEAVWIFSRQGSAFRSEQEAFDVEDSEIPTLARRKKLYLAAVIAEDNFVGLLMGALRPRE